MLVALVEATTATATAIGQVGKEESRVQQCADEQRTTTAMSWRDNDFYRYYMQQPPVTRTLLTGVALTSLPPLLYLVSPVHLVNFWDYTVRGEVWRPVTAFLYGGGGIELLFGLFFIYQYSMQLETSKFGSSTADYAWYLLFNCVTILFLNYFTNAPVYFNALTLALCTTACLETPSQQTALFGMLRMPMLYLPYAMLAISFVTGGPSAALIQGTGLASAHLWRHVSETMPANGAPNHVATPNWVRAILGDGTYLSGTAADASAGGTARPWGRAFAPNKDNTTPIDVGNARASDRQTMSAGSGTRSNIATLGGGGGGGPGSSARQQTDATKARRAFSGQGHVLGGE